MKKINTHKMHLKPDYFNMMKTGEKGVEFRLFDEKRQNIKIGDKIQFICETDNNSKFIRTVQDLKTSSKFTLLLNFFPEYRIIKNKEKMLTKLNKIYNRCEEEKYGVIAICLGE